MTLENIQFIVSLATLVGFIVIAYKTFRDPVVKADKSIEVLKEQIKQEKQSYLYPKMPVSDQKQC